MTKQTPPLTLDLRRHRTGSVRLCATAADLDLPESPELRFAEAVEVEVTIQDIAGGARLRLRAKTSATAECFRCLESYTLPLEAGFDVICRARDMGDMDDRVVRMNPRRPVISLGPLVREALLLEIPMRRICRPGCAGLCPECGVNLNEEECRCGRSG